MRIPHRIPLLTAAAAISLLQCQARSYIVERGDTWESIARMWGVHTDELKATNPFFTELFVGVELDLPANSSDTPLDNANIAILVNEDRRLDEAEKQLEAGQHERARANLSSAMTRRGHTTARLAYLYGRACEGSGKYAAALESYSNAATLFNGGDRTMDNEQLYALNGNMERVAPLAMEEKRREEEERQRRREERARQARLEAQRQEEKRQRRREFWGNLGNALLQGFAAATQPQYGGWGASAWSAPMPATTFNYTPTYTPLVMPAIDWTNVQVDWNSVPMNFNNTPIQYDWDTPVFFDGGVGMDSGYDYGDTSTGETDGNTSIEYESIKCSVCDGTGWMVNNNVTTMGQTGTKYCDICHKHVSLSHGHQRCPSCKNGYQKRRIR